jgi:hypothetical protein
LQRWVTAPMVEQEGHGVREDFAKQPTCQMPEVFCPHPLYGVTSGQLRKDGIYPVAKTAQQSALFGVGISFLGGVGSQELNRHARQLFLRFGRVVVAVTDDDPGGKLDEFGEQMEFMSVGRSYAQTSDDAWPGYRFACRLAEGYSSSILPYSPNVGEMEVRCGASKGPDK